MADDEDNEGVFADSSSTGRHVERSSADTSATVSLDGEAEARWQAQLRAQHESQQASKPDPWAPRSSGPSGPIGEVDDQVWRDTGAGILDALRQGLEAVPGAAEVMHAIVPRPLVSEADTDGVDVDVDVDVDGIASLDEWYEDNDTSAPDESAFDAVTDDWADSPELDA